MNKTLKNIINHTIELKFGAEIFYHNNEEYQILKVNVDFNKPFGRIYYLDGIKYICINKNADEEENNKIISRLLNMDTEHTTINNTKHEIMNINKESEINGIYKDLIDEDIVIVKENSTLSEFRSTHKLSNYIDKMGYEINDMSDIWKLLIFYKMGIMQGKREERKRKLSKTTGGK